ncbi:hypothetical protein OQA88_9576 [Cercophora sp. LCS_1]
MASKKTKSRIVIVRLVSMAATGFFYTFTRPRTASPMSMLKYDPIAGLKGDRNETWHICTRYAQNTKLTGFSSPTKGPFPRAEEEMSYMKWEDIVWRLGSGLSVGRTHVLMAQYPMRTIRWPGDKMVNGKEPTSRVKGYAV